MRSYKKEAPIVAGLNNRDNEMNEVIFSKIESESVVKDAFYEKLYNLNSENTIELAQLFFDNRNTAMSAEDVISALGYEGKVTIAHKVRDLTGRGFVFDNLAENGKPGLWVMIGVKKEKPKEKKKRAKCPMPTLNPFIESVFC